MISRERLDAVAGLLGNLKLAAIGRSKDFVSRCSYHSRAGSLFNAAISLSILGMRKAARRENLNSWQDYQ